MDSGNSGSGQSSSGGDEEYDSRAESFPPFLTPTTQFHPPPTLLRQHQTPSTSTATTLFDPMTSSSSLFHLDPLWPRPSNPTSITPHPHPPRPPPAPPQPPPPSSSSSPTAAARNPRKRSRASRRAPTTVLTTDTTNFRAMVQEFTGVPSPPFSSSSAFLRPRLDLFSSPPPPPTPAPPTYLLKPFPLKLQPPPSMADAIASTTTNSSRPMNHHHQSMQTLNNLTFQSLFQSPPKYPFPNSPILGGSNASNLKVGLLDDFGLSQGHADHTHLAGLQDLSLPVGASSSTRRSEPSSGHQQQQAVTWVDRSVGSSNGAVQGHHDHHLIRSSTTPTVDNAPHDYDSNSKLNFSASASASASAPSSSFQGEKGLDNVTTRGDGLVDSWLCSTD